MGAIFATGAIFMAIVLVIDVIAEMQLDKKKSSKKKDEKKND